MAERFFGRSSVSRAAAGQSIFSYRSSINYVSASLRRLLTICALVVAGLTGATSRSQQPASATVIAITNVDVLPMDGNRVLKHQTVIVRDGRIAAIGDADRLALSAGASRVDGTGRFVVPGLADMHSHIHDRRDLATMQRAGVTTLLDMGGGGAAFHRIATELRQRRAAPQILTALKIDGPGDEGGSAVVPATVAEARAAVQRAQREGYDFVKVYSRLSAPMFDAVMAEARRLRMPVIGHVVRSVGLEASLRRGQKMIAHAEEYLTVFDDAAPNPGRIPELVRTSSRHGIYVTANIAGLRRIADQWGRPEMTARNIAEGEARGVRPEILRQWQRSSYARLSGSYAAEADFAEQLVAALHRTGVPILIGTDAPDIPGAGPGYSVHDEMDALRRVGFSAYDSLAAATSVPGAFVARFRPALPRFGQVRAGFRADLLLVNGDPRLDLSVLRRPERVMAAGQWVDTAPGSATADPPPPAQLSRAQVIEDLTFFRDVYAPLERSYDTKARADMLAYIAGRIRDAQPMSRAQIAMVFARAQAFSRNNHTQNDIFDEESDFHPLPISFWWFPEGAIITRAHSGSQWLLGARIISIGGVPIEQAAERVGPYISGIAQHRRYVSPSWLRRLEVLQALGLADASGTELVVELQGRRRAVRLEVSPDRDPAVLSSPWRESMVPGKGNPAWPHVIDRLVEPPLYLRPPADLAYEFLRDGRLLYIRSNDTFSYDDAAPIPLKAYRMMDAAMVRPVPPRDVVVDLRFNEGGDFFNILPLAQELIAMTAPRGRIYVITGRATNSAAIIFTALLKGGEPKRTTIVGEGIADREQFWSEGGNITAPVSRLPLRYTDGYHDWANGCTDRSRCYWPAMLHGAKAGSLAPDIPVAMSFRDFAAGVDPSLNAVLRDIDQRGGD